jgi:ribosomal protein L25 (general stress protein Ctc)
MKLNVHIRQEEKSRELRKEGNIPAIVYGKHLSAPVSIFCNKNEFIKKFKQSGYSTALILEGK